jgi:hypothetical protein
MRVEERNSFFHTTPADEDGKRNYVGKQVRTGEDRRDKNQNICRFFLSIEYVEFGISKIGVLIMHV